MARILVLYGTTDGHTAKIARAIANTLRTGGAGADVIEARTANPRPADYDGIIVAASLHAGEFQKPVQQWVRAHAQELQSKPSALAAVCLAVLQREPEVQRSLDAIINRFLTATGWQPVMARPVAGAVLYTRYNWIKRWLMRRIVRKAGGDTDTSRDYEYTDWDDLRLFAEQFLDVVRGTRAADRGPDSSGSARVA